MIQEETPVTVILLGDPVAVVRGVLMAVGEASFTVRVFGGELTVGRRLVAAAGDLKLAGQVASVEGGVATATRFDVQGTDDRAAPRVQAPVALSWRCAGGPWHRVAAEDVSIAGARFLVVADPPPVGAHLEVELHLEEAGHHRVEAIVRRSSAGPDGWTVAVEFVEVSDQTSDALADLTLRG